MCCSSLACFIKSRIVSLQTFQRFHLFESRFTMTTKSLPCCANLGFLFKEESDFIPRMRKASEGGFQAVEYPFPVNVKVEDILSCQRETGLTTILMNTDPAGSENGLAALPGKEPEFLKSLELSINYCKALQCKNLHVLAGVVEKPTKEHDETFEKNIRIAVDRCEEAGITALLEPISQVAVPNYYLHDFDKAVELIQKLDRPNLKLQVDLYHLQRTKGNLSANITEWFPLIGHIQVAQVPNRNEPDTPGEINYPFIFELLTSLNYDKWIGLEYHPKIAGDVKAGMGFIFKNGLTRFVPQ